MFGGKFNIVTSEGNLEKEREDDRERGNKKRIKIMRMHKLLRNTSIMHYENV